jgi:integrase
MARKGGKDRGIVEKPKGSGTWWVRLSLDHRERWWRCDSKSQAKALYGKLKGQQREQRLFPKEKKRQPLLFQTVAAEYEQKVDADRRRPGDDRSRIQFWVDRFGNQDVETITESQIEQALVSLRTPLPSATGRLAKGQRRSYETMRRYFGVAHAILERARKTLKREYNVNMMNPATDLEFKKPDNMLVRYLTPDQEAALLNALPPRYHPLVLTAINTGMRRGELLRLTWADVDWFAGTLAIRETKADEPRHAPMNSIVQRALLGLKETNQPGPSDPVFPFYPRYLSRAFNRAVTQAKLTPFRFHDLRHCFASRLARLGANDRTLMQAGGWASPAMLKRYVHLGPSNVWQAVEGLTQFATGSTTGSDTKIEPAPTTESSKPIEKTGEPPGTRTQGPRLKRAMLYRLS